MSIVTLLRAGMKKQRASIIGTGLLMLVVTLSITLGLTASVNTSAYLTQEMNRLGFGELTAWINDSHPQAVLQELNTLPDVSEVHSQPLLFSGYHIGTQHSDNEGQLIAYNPQAYDYRLLSGNLNSYTDVAPKPGEVYLSPAMQSSLHVALGDEVVFELGRDGTQKTLSVAGWFEDPFMGSSMIDMKSFLVSEQDYSDMLASIQGISDFNRLARSGAMLHISQKQQSSLSPAAFQRRVFDNTSLASVTEFSYTQGSIAGFMLILPQVFMGFLLAFSLVLLVVAMVVTGHSISTSIEQDYRDIGILKTIGLTATGLRAVQLLEYGLGICVGIGLGLLGGVLCMPVLSSLLITSCGLLIPPSLAAAPMLVTSAVILLLFLLFIMLKTRRILRVSPLMAISGTVSQLISGKPVPRIRAKGLSFFLALREVSSKYGRYISTCLIAAVLVLFVSIVARMNVWLGPQGEGLMDAFSAADHDIGIQPTRDMDMTQAEALIKTFSPIVERYELAMQSVTIGGVEVTANAINDPSFFHIITGRTCENESEIVITNAVSNDLGLSIGDTVRVAGHNAARDYTVTGIYQCANEMGANIGMTRNGYAMIADADGYIWCYHYILANGQHNQAVMDALSAEYRIMADIHTNSWSGLSGIVVTMRLLTLFMLVIVTLFILVVSCLTSSKLLLFEQQDMAVYRCIGFKPATLRLSFVLRFGVVAAVGAVIGITVSVFTADACIASLLSLFGIGAFRADAGAFGTLLPGLLVVALFMVFAALFSRRINRNNLQALMTD